MNEACNEIQLQRFLDDELGKAKRDRIEQHLAGCEPCRARIEALRLQGELLRESLESAVAEMDFSGFDDRVMARIRAESPPPLWERASVWLREAAYHYRAVWITSLATAVVVLAVLIPLLSRDSTPVPTEPGRPTSAIADSRVDNEVIIDSMEYSGQRSMIFTVSKNNTTVIWLYDFDRAEEEKAGEDDI